MNARLNAPGNEKGGIFMIAGFLIAGVLELQVLKSMYSNLERKRAGMKIAPARWKQAGVLG